MRERRSATLLALCHVLWAASCGAPSGAPQARPSASGAPSSAAGPPTARRSAPFVVAIVVDQLPAWVAVERFGALPRSGGFARLIDESSDAVVLRYRHAHNATAMGHAALFTGAVPRDSGIVANGKLLDDGTYRSSFFDDGTEMVTDRPGSTGRKSSSLSTLVAPTVADALRQKSPEAIVVSLSMKDRGALFGGGRSPNAALWFDATTDAFVSSSAFFGGDAAPATPAWAAAFTAPGSGARYRLTPWSPLDPKWLQGHATTSVDVGQGDFHGLGRSFPHDLANASPPPRAFVATPFADRMLVDLTRAAIDHTSRVDRPTLLAVSLSATDYVGHVFGPDAPEAWDQMLRLDGLLAELLAHLDRTLGPDRYAVVLSSDHGVPPTPEVLRERWCARPGADPFDRACDAPVRLTEAGLAKIAEDAADRAVGPGKWVRGGNEPFVELEPAARALAPADHQKLMSAALRTLEGTPGILRAVEVAKTPDTCPPLDDESLDALVCRSVRKNRPGDIFVVMQRGSFIDTGYVEGDGVNHGTHWLFDRTVPIVVRPPRAGGAPAPKAFDPTRSVDHRAYAATLAVLLGIEPPAAARGGAVLSRTKAP